MSLLAITLWVWLIYLKFWKDAFWNSLNSLKPDFSIILNGFNIKSNLGGQGHKL